MSADATPRADFSGIRYAQCWEDADVLLAALDIHEGDVCLSIASAGDNALAMLAHSPCPRKVIALDLSSAQLACLALRVAAYRTLTHAELLELIGSRPSDRRGDLYRRCRTALAEKDRAFWNAHPQWIAQGIGSAGKFERYFRFFRLRVMPLIHRRRIVDQLLAGGELDQRRSFYQTTWDNRRWRLMFRIFFSRWVMGRYGRDPEFFRYVEGSVADRILHRSRHALTDLNPAENPYLHWILRGRHGDVLPYALRPEHFDAIRHHLDRIEWHQASVEDFLARWNDGPIARFNLSDIFEYMPLEAYHGQLELILSRAQRGARLAYWNMLAPRSRPEDLADRLIARDDLAGRLHLLDKAFFYQRFVVEEVA